MALITPARPGLAAALLVATGLPALAQDNAGGAYLRLFGGASFLSGTDLAGVAGGSVGFDRGVIGGGALGYDYPGSPFRAELEFAYRSAEADGAAGLGGDFASTTLAINGYYDFAPLGGGRLTPYVGAGLAYLTEIDFDLSGGAAPGQYSDRGGVGFQVMVGAEYRLSPRWALNGELRYFDAGRQTLGGPGGATLSADYSSVEVIFGATLRF